MRTPGFSDERRVGRTARRRARGIAPERAGRPRELTAGPGFGLSAGAGRRGVGRACPIGRRGRTAGGDERQAEICELVGKRGFLTIEAMAQHFGVTVQTIRRDVNLLAAEGRLARYRGGAVTGQTAVEMFDRFRADIGIIGISGIDRDGGRFDYDLDEVLCAQAILRNARRVFLLADHSKFGRAGLVRVGSMTQVSALYTDAPPPEPIAVTSTIGTRTANPSICPSARISGRPPLTSA
ncbi:MAG: DeoR family transcriptional regulator, partial [Acetobacteraceae bacterium]